MKKLKVATVVFCITTLFLVGSTGFGESVSKNDVRGNSIETGHIAKNDVRSFKV